MDRSRRTCSHQPVGATALDIAHQGCGVDGKAKIIFPTIMAGVMAFLMTGVVTFLNVGVPPDFLRRWATAFVIAWPLATISAMIAMPIARRLTQRIVVLLDGKRA